MFVFKLFDGLTWTAAPAGSEDYEKLGAVPRGRAICGRPSRIMTHIQASCVALINRCSREPWFDHINWTDFRTCNTCRSIWVMHLLTNGFSPVSSSS